MLSPDEPLAWPAVGFEPRPWHGEPEPGQSRRSSLRSRGPYDAAVVPPIATRRLPAFDDDTAVLLEEALLDLSRFDSAGGSVVAPFSAILLRSESAASSQIENLTASAKSIALAEFGRKSGGNSRLVVGNVRALQAALELADDLDEASIVRMQSEILKDDSPEFVGGWRERPVWIGGGFSNSPHGAAFVPPHHDRVGAAMTDLVAFARRLDLPALPQIAVAHAQFETIHPFPDGNGRTGRALIQAMLHRLGVTSHVMVPVSAGLLQDTDGYFGALTAYREGDVVPIVRALATASSRAVVNGRRLVADLTEARVGWSEAVTSRRGSAASRLLDVLQRQPVLDAAVAGLVLGVSTRNAQNGIDDLVAAGVVRQIGTGTRNRVYEAPAVLEALDAFAARARRSRH
ncbi:Fic family protein [Frondihabitans cladoniiphilus]|uniref:Fic family protein n=1 Tax=Frondihabitans cladoniiphilus TaxID=715785 RepID=A0ABP8VUN1_9MICO